MRRALITGVTGQDGSYLSELLLAKGYEVHGLARRTSTPNYQNVRHLFNHPGFKLCMSDVTDLASLVHLLRNIEPDEIYNLAAQSHVGESFKQPLATIQINGLGTVNLLEALRLTNPTARFYQASTSELFGDSDDFPQHESTPFRPRSPYATAKALAHHAAVNYREAYGMFTACGILFNHESPRRGEQFVTRKITKAAARIRLGLQDKLALGNVTAARDWGYAPDYVEAMWLMLQQNHGGDYIVATGQSRTVRDFMEAAFDAVGLDWTEHVVLDESLMRPSDVSLLMGNPGKAERELNWHPKTKFREMVQIMVNADLRLAEEEKDATANGRQSTRL